MNSTLIELFECLDAVIHDYCTTYDPHEDRESVMATVSTQKMVALHQAYDRCKKHWFTIPKLPDDIEAPEGD